ncbi:DUF2934 domain-containing protein [Lacibacterium aquatile]|uniref:DUF2934 domain-containing protein n=1 Tax=Lacibacterium aquatile TaxID=1168082 RepID=A0ABW5DRE7_9PROT
MSEELRKKIAERAHAIWEQEGRPEGRDAVHWEMARNLLKQEDALKPKAVAPGEEAKEQPDEAQPT